MVRLLQAREGNSLDVPTGGRGLELVLERLASKLFVILERLALHLFAHGAEDLAQRASGVLALQ